MTEKVTATNPNGQVNTGAYDTARTQAINDMYDAQKASRLSELESAYNTSKSDYEAAAQKIQPQYQQSANDLATQYEKQRQAFQRQSMASGLNSGTGAQEALARSGQYQRDIGNLRTEQANAFAENQRQQNNLTSQYQSNVAAALSENDYQRAAALLDEYNNGYNRQMQEAQNLASLGDFSGYAALYGQERADALQKIWNAQNPDIAWGSGAITAEEYKTITGKYPKGYSTGVSGYYGEGSNQHRWANAGTTKNSSSATSRTSTVGTGISNQMTPTAIQRAEKAYYK